MEVRFVDDRWPQFDSTLGSSLYGGLQGLGWLTSKVDTCIDAVDNSALRQTWQATLINAGIPLATLGDFAHLGVGVSTACVVPIERRTLLRAGFSTGYGAVLGKGAVVAPGTALTVGH